MSYSWGDGDDDPYDGYDLNAMFDAVVISGETGMRKPDPAIHLLTADKLGAPPQECVFADDTAAITEISRLLGIP